MGMRTTAGVSRRHGTQSRAPLNLFQLKNGKYNLISVWFNKISKIYLCVHTDMRTTAGASLGVIEPQIKAPLNPPPVYTIVILYRGV